MVRRLVGLQWYKVVLVHPWFEIGVQRVDMNQDGGLHRDVSQVWYIYIPWFFPSVDLGLYQLK